MTLTEAATKSNMSYASGLKYYRKFLKDHNHDIPVPVYQCGLRNLCTQNQIDILISSLVDNKMTLCAASKKAGMTSGTGRKYYREYLKDSEHRIPVSHVKQDISSRAISCTQDQIKKLISYIVDDNLTIKAASKKANMGICTGSRFYQQYKNDPNHAIPRPRPKYNPRQLTQDRISEPIGYIVDDKMTIKAASKKANVNYASGQRYYHRYIDNQKNAISTTASHPQEEIDKFIGYIFKGKMSPSAASEKVNMDPETGKKYYQQYLEDHAIPSHIASNQICTQDQVKKLIGLIVDDKMTIPDASKIVNVSPTTARKYFNEHIKTNAIPSHIVRRLPFTQNQATDVIRYIVKDKMSILEASKEAKMCEASGRKFYNRLVRDRQ
jgi:transposase